MCTAIGVSMKAPVVIVTATLTLAILLAASLLIATGTRGENALRPPAGNEAGRILPAPTPAKQDRLNQTSEKP
jgi:hypothetical protein